MAYLKPLVLTSTRTIKTVSGTPRGSELIEVAENDPTSLRLRVSGAGNISSQKPMRRCGVVDLLRGRG